MFAQNSSIASMYLVFQRIMVFDHLILIYSGLAGVERNNVWFHREWNQIKLNQTSEVETKNKYSLKVLNKLGIFLLNMFYYKSVK